MDSFRFKFGKFLLILGGLSLLIFVFSIIAESPNFKILLAAFILIVFGAVFRSTKKELTDLELPTAPSPKFKKRQYRQHEKYEQQPTEDQNQQSFRQRRR